VDVVGLDSQLDNLPPLLLTLLLNEPATLSGNRASENGLPPFGCPDKVVDDKVNTVFVALILHSTRSFVDRCIEESISRNKRAVKFVTCKGWKPTRSRAYHSEAAPLLDENL